MEWWVIIVTVGLSLATFGLYRLVDRLRAKP